jgi:hypothetical protein
VQNTQFFVLIIGKEDFNTAMSNAHMEGYGPVRQAMSTNATDDTDGATVDQGERERYAELNIGDEEYVVYDRENHQAWIQSTVAIAAEDIR